MEKCLSQMNTAVEFICVNCKLSNQLSELALHHSHNHHSTHFRCCCCCADWNRRSTRLLVESIRSIKWIDRKEKWKEKLEHRNKTDKWHHNRINIISHHTFTMFSMRYVIGIGFLFSLTSNYCSICHDFEFPPEFLLFHIYTYFLVLSLSLCCRCIHISYDDRNTIQFCMWAICWCSH